MNNAEEGQVVRGAKRPLEFSLSCHIRLQATAVSTKLQNFTLTYDRLKSLESLKPV